jgi:hypothetical protein
VITNPPSRIAPHEFVRGHDNDGVATALRYPGLTDNNNTTTTASTDILGAFRPFWKVNCSHELQACMRAAQVLAEGTP